MRKEELQKKVDRTVTYSSNLAVPELDDFFYTRLKQRIENSLEEVFSWKRMVLRYSFVVVLFAINVYSFMGWGTNDKPSFTYDKEVVLNQVASEYFSSNIHYE